MQAKNLYGKSLGFPPRVGANGQMMWSEGELNVRESIVIILRTRPGERVNLPQFGCNLEQYLFEPNSIATLRLMQETVIHAVTRWEPRVALDDVLVETVSEEPRAVNITIYYTLIATAQREGLAITVST